MSDFNSLYNRAVWFDIPVVDLERAIAFYSAVLGVKVTREEMNGCAFGLLYHAPGNGGCLYVDPSHVAANKGPLLYLNVDKRIRDSINEVIMKGGKVLENVHSLGPHGFRAIVLDSEGNRIALHSNIDA